MEKKTIETKIRHVDPEVWNLAKAFLRTEYGTHYAHLGDFISYCIKFTLQHAFNVRGYEDLNNPKSKSNFFSNIRSKKKEHAIIKMCKEFSEFPEDTYSTSTIRNVVVRALAEVGYTAPSKQTIYNYINHFTAVRALINVHGGFKLNPRRFKEILDSLTHVPQVDSGGLVVVVKKRG